jgi:hypothetical protein
MTITNKLSALTLFIFASVPAISSAASSDTSGFIISKPIKEVWINPGFYSYHFDTEKNLNNNNFGLGVEYRYSTVNSIAAGRFNNSDRKISYFAGWSWQPLALGPVRLGGVVGIINGYPKANNGDWFPFILPVASYEYKRVGISVTLTPTYKDIIYGSLTVQLKLKVN